MPEAGFQATNAFTECKFTCTSGKCLYLGSLVCNQQNDCGDNSDEENCLLVTEHPPPGIFNSELEFAQVLIIVVVVTVMVVVVVCLLNHYKVSTRSFINRPNQSQRQEDGLQPVSVWVCAVWNAPGLHSGVANPDQGMGKARGQDSPPVGSLRY